MRTYDKLIATIPARRNTRIARSCFGRSVAACAFMAMARAAGTQVSG